MGFKMLTINAQADVINRDWYTLTHVDLTVFVCDEDGERVFELKDAGGPTLDSIGRTGGFVGAAIIEESRAVRECVEFCGDRDFWISPAVGEALKRKHDNTIYKLIEGN